VKICEIFESLIGEGRYAGHPAVFVRLSGCTRNCSFCDTKYHKKEKKYTPKELAEKINKSQLTTVVWTGGEPLMQHNDIYNVITYVVGKNHHLESNGDLIDEVTSVLDKFQYLCFSPKNINSARKILNSNIMKNKYDIKIVTDLDVVGQNLIVSATMLMPLTTGNEKQDKKIEQDVWNYCVKHNIKFCLRQHVKVWGTKRGV
jgi:organic radical activating enzyme